MGYKLSYLFEKCNSINYDVVGDGVSYKFIEENKEGICTLYIYFQGSNQTTDWIRNFLFGKKPYKDMNIPYRVHRGFLAAWKEVEDIVIEKIKEKVVTEVSSPYADPEANFNPSISPIIKYKYNKIFIIGYSHGGALAQFCHECVWFHRPDLRKEGLFTFAFEAPRIYAGYKVKDELKQRWKSCYIIRNNNDIVTHCPPKIFGYADLGNRIQIHGDISSVKSKWIPKCIKSHYPMPVYDGLVKWEKV